MKELLGWCGRCLVEQVLKERIARLEATNEGLCRELHDYRSRYAVVEQFEIDAQALLKMGIRGVMVSDVQGFGAQGGSKERYGGSEFSKDKFVAKVKMEIVVSKDQVEVVVDKIMEEARTGEIGDGKIFCERGEKAERMAGGRRTYLQLCDL